MGDPNQVCDGCKKELKPGDSIVFTPDGSPTQRHLCMTCFEGLGTSESA